MSFSIQRFWYEILAIPAKPQTHSFSFLPIMSSPLTLLPLRQHLVGWVMSDFASWPPSSPISPMSVHSQSLPSCVQCGFRSVSHYSCGWMTQTRQIAQGLWPPSRSNRSPSVSPCGGLLLHTIPLIFFFNKPGLPSVFSSFFFQNMKVLKCAWG